MNSERSKISFDTKKRNKLLNCILDNFVLSICQKHFSIIELTIQKKYSSYL